MIHLHQAFAHAHFSRLTPLERWAAKAAPGSRTHILVSMDGGRQQAFTQVAGRYWEPRAPYTTPAVDLLARASECNISISRKPPHEAVRQVVTDWNEVRPAPGLKVAVLCPGGPAWPNDWRGLDIDDGQIQWWEPLPQQGIGSVLNVAFSDFASAELDVWIRPGWAPSVTEATLSQRRAA